MTKLEKMIYDRNILDKSSTMLIPVRCFTCNKVIGQKWTIYQDKVSEHLDSGETEMDANCKALDHVGLTRYCCRRMLLSHVNIIDQMLLYSNNPGENSAKYTDLYPHSEEIEGEQDENDDYTFIGDDSDDEKEE